MDLNPSHPADSQSVVKPLDGSMETTKTETLSDDCDEESGLSLSTGSSGISDSKSDDDEDDKAIKEQITKRETQAVFSLRVLVIVILIIKTFVITVVMFSITNTGESAEFSNQYEAAAEKIIAS